VSLAEARRRFKDEYSPAISSGADPASQHVRRRHNKEAPSATVEELFLAYVANLRRAGRRSTDIIERILLSEKSGAARAIGKDRLAASVTPDDIVAFLKGIHARGSVVMAFKARAYLGAAFSFGLKSPYDYRNEDTAPSWGLTMNPVVAVKSDETAQRTSDRFLSVTEFRAFWLWLVDYGKKSRLAYAARIEMATGQRVEEVLRMSVGGLDRATKTYNWTVTKNRMPQTIPLPPVVIEILDELRPNRHGLYFPHKNKPDQPANYSGILCLIKRYIELTGAEKFTARCIRRSWKTLAGAAGLSKEIRDRLQNHSRLDISSRHYDRWEMLPEKRAAMNQWISYMAMIISGELDEAGLERRGQPISLSEVRARRAEESCMSALDDKPSAATMKSISDFERELPDIFDDADCRPGPSKLSEAYHEAVVPEHVKERIRAIRAKAKPPETRKDFMATTVEITMKFIENEGALFRGPARGHPREVWSDKERRFIPYKGSVPKPVGWGREISQADAWRMMAIGQGARDFGTPPG
jgi:integrase